MFSAPDSEHWEVEVWKQWEEGRVVGRGELLSENVENEEENEQTGKLFNTIHQTVSLLPISDVEGGQQVVEAVGQAVASDGETTKSNNLGNVMPVF